MWTIFKKTGRQMISAYSSCWTGSFRVASKLSRKKLIEGSI